MRRGAQRAVVVVLAAALPACGLFRDRPPRPPAAGGTPAPEPPRVEIQRVAEPITVRAWAEPRRLPPMGGQAQILVLVRRKTGEPLPGVQVRLESDHGTLFSRGRILTTDEAGRTRDRLTARRSATVTVNAGGTIHRVEVAVARPRG